MYVKLAWRNIWRNKRRSIITMGSIFFAVFFALMMRSMQLGSYDMMIESMVRFYSGYIQIHANGYWDEQTLDNSMEFNEELEKQVLAVEGVDYVLPRVEGFALGSFEQLTKGVMIVGVDLNLEDKLMKLSDKLVKGELFTKDDKSVLIAEGLAEYFGIKENDTIILLSQGYHGVSAAGKYPVSGVLKFGSPQLNDNMIFLPLKESQWFYGAENRVTSYVLMIENSKQMKAITGKIKAIINTDKYEVMDWKELMPELVQIIQADNVGGIIMLFILYMIITFGIFGTVLMMTNERRYEFGVLLSVGMRRWKIALVVFIETLFMSIIGAIAGIIAAEPLMYYINANPIKLTGDAAEAVKDYGFEPLMPTSTDPTIILAHSLIIIMVALVISAYPAIIIARLKPANAIRH